MSEYDKWTKEMLLNEIQNLNKEIDDYIDTLQDIADGCGPADNMADNILAKYQMCREKP